MLVICQLELMECVEKADVSTATGAGTVLYKCNKSRVIREIK